MKHGGHEVQFSEGGTNIQIKSKYLIVVVQLMVLGEYSSFILITITIHPSGIAFNPSADNYSGENTSHTNSNIIPLQIADKRA